MAGSQVPMRVLVYLHSFEAGGVSASRFGLPANGPPVDRTSASPWGATAVRNIITRRTI